MGNDAARSGREVIWSLEGRLATDTEATESG